MPPRRRPRYLHRHIAHHLAQRRQDAGLTQEQLAQRAGLHRTYIGAIERGERNISLATLETLADALNTPPSTLLTESTDHPD